MRVLLTCGIGDFLAIESHLTADERAGVEVVHWATRAREWLLPLIPFAFPNVREHVTERDVWGPPGHPSYSVGSRDELPGLDPAVVDWSVRRIIEQVHGGERPFTGSTFAATPLCAVAHLDLPREFAVIHPYSENARTPLRDLTADEWALTSSRMRSRAMPIVIVNQGRERFAPAPGVIDLTNRLTLLEAMEVTKRAFCFVGAASVFSVIAAKKLTADRLFIKGNVFLKNQFSAFYYAPHESNSFIGDNLMEILPNA